MGATWAGELLVFAVPNPRDDVKIEQPAPLPAPYGTGGLSNENLVLAEAGRIEDWQEALWFILLGEVARFRAAGEVLMDV